MLIFLPSERDGGTENTMKKKVIMIFLVAVLAMAAFSCARSEDENSQFESAYSDAENSTDAGSRTDGGSDFSSDKSDGGKTEDNRDSKEDGKTEEEITPDGEEPDPDDGDGVDGTTRNELINTDENSFDKGKPINGDNNSKTPVGDDKETVFNDNKAPRLDNNGKDHSAEHLRAADNYDDQTRAHTRGADKQQPRKVISHKGKRPYRSECGL